MASEREQTIRSFSRATAEDLAVLEIAVQREKEWYANAPQFWTNEEIETAYLAGQLQRVESSPDVQLLRRFNDDPDKYKAYGTPEIVTLVDVFGGLWRKNLEQNGINDPNLRLALTSLVRSLKYQVELIESGTLATMDSTHTKAAAVDFDVSGYYRINDQGIAVSHGHPERKAQQDNSRVDLARTFGAACLTHVEYDYDQRIMGCAIDAAMELHESEHVNLVHEFPGTSNAVLHMAVNPNYGQKN